MGSHLRNDRRTRDVAWAHARRFACRTGFTADRRTRHAPKPPWPCCRTCCTRSPTTTGRSRLRAESSTSPQLTDHLMNSITVIGGAAGAELPERDPGDSVERQVVAAARPALDAWHRRGLDGTVAFGENEAPARMMAGILSLEFLVHAWDYAMAMGEHGACARLAVGLRDGTGAGRHHAAGPHHRRLRRPGGRGRRRARTGPAGRLHRSPTGRLDTAVGHAVAIQRRANSRNASFSCGAATVTRTPSSP